MDIRQLRYFMVVAQEGQFTRAAERLHMAQPPLSQQIKQLEEELGVVLLKRGGRHVELTQAGQALLARAEQILELVGSAKKEMEDLQRGSQGTISIGTVSSCGAYLLPKSICDMHDKYPEVRFQIWESDTYRIMELVDRGIVDVGFVRTPFSLEAYDHIYLSGGERDPMTAIFSEKWACSLTGDIALEELKGFQLLVHRRYESMISEACEKLGFQPDILCKGDEMRSIISWAELGLGVAVIPKPPEITLQNTSLRYHDISCTSLETMTAAIWPKSAYLPKLIRNFIEIIK